jgi:hypothetical protein
VPIRFSCRLADFLLALLKALAERRLRRVALDVYHGEFEGPPDARLRHDEHGSSNGRLGEVKLFCDNLARYLKAYRWTTSSTGNTGTTSQALWRSAEILLHLAFSSLDAPGCTNSSNSPSTISSELTNWASLRPSANGGLIRQNSTTKREKPARIK